MNAMPVIPTRMNQDPIDLITVGDRLGSQRRRV
jgi:hypothetical protein